MYNWSNKNVQNVILLQLKRLNAPDENNLMWTITIIIDIIIIIIFFNIQYFAIKLFSEHLISV
jgi:hypothetical protein